MRRRGSGRGALLVLSAVALAVAFVLPARDTSAAGNPIPIKVGLIKPLKLFKVISKPTGPLFAIPPDIDTLGNPIPLGGSVTVNANGETLLCNLAAADFNDDKTEGWKGLGNPKGSKGWKYLNKLAPSGGSAGACKLVLVKDKVIKVLAKAAADIPVNGEGANTDVSIEISAGNTGYCALGLASEHFKEIDGKLLKMKDQAAPADCGPSTTTTVTTMTTTTTLPCDCSGYSRLAFETSIGSGNAGVLRNYRCGEPGDTGLEDLACDPDNGNADCDLGTCYNPGPLFCEGSIAVPCVTNADCQGTCQEISAGNLPLDLKRGGLYTGGGLNSVPLPFPVPDQGVNIHNISGGSPTMTLSATTPAEVGERQCTQGRTCNGGGNDGLHCVLASDCPGGSCKDNCVFGPPLPIPNAGQPATSVCAVNVVDIDSSGTADCRGGDADVATPLRSVIYLNGDLFSSSNLPNLPGVQPCPLCVPLCSGGSEDGSPCRPDNPNRACVGGQPGVPGRPCTDDSDCPGTGGACAPARTEYTDCINGGGTCPDPLTGSECLGGPDEGNSCTPASSTSDLLLDPQDSYPTSHDCRSDSLKNITLTIGGLPVNFALTSGTQIIDAQDHPNGERVFCGFCRDVSGGGSLKFEGDTTGPLATPPATGNAVPCDSDYECQHMCAGGTNQFRPCAGDGDCPGSTCVVDTDTYESCAQRNPGAFNEAVATRIEVSGETDGQCMEDGLPHSSTLVSIFCVPPTFDSTVDAAGDLPGPGAALLLGDAQVY